MKKFPTFYNQPMKTFPNFYNLKTHHRVHKKHVLFELHVIDAMTPYFFNIILPSMLRPTQLAYRLNDLHSARNFH